MTAENLIETRLENLRWHSQKNDRNQEEVDNRFFQAIGEIIERRKSGEIDLAKANEYMDQAIAYRHAE